MKKLLILLMFFSFNAFAGPVDINKASAKEIASALDGVGDKKAAEIVKYRKQHGAFKSLDDLKNVKGIGEKTVAKNKKNIQLKAGKTTNKATKTKTSTKDKSKVKTQKKTKEKKGSSKTKASKK